MDPRPGDIVVQNVPREFKRLCLDSLKANRRHNLRLIKKAGLKKNFMKSAMRRIRSISMVLELNEQKKYTERQLVTLKYCPDYFQHVLVASKQSFFFVHNGSAYDFFASVSHTDHSYWYYFLHLMEKIDFRSVFVDNYFTRIYRCLIKEDLDYYDFCGSAEFDEMVKNKGIVGSVSSYLDVHGGDRHAKKMSPSQKRVVEYNKRVNDLCLAVCSKKKGTKRKRGMGHVSGKRVRF